ncbi:PhzF family phenazine biosynthesis protein [Sulfurimonas sp.]|uniref:PhzF family phenazine biosynthesis protein n=1 Tax=Sulfurimonas sp. TaxID=2022749 RepID=UPI003D09C35D
MQLKMYQIDAFAKNVFEGNSAAVVSLESWLDDELMQKIAMENNLSETVFFVKEGGHYHIRWFTPLAEVDMCGHATLASAYVLFELLGFSGDTVVFDSKSGLLRVQKEHDKYVMDFPAQKLEECEIPKELQEAFSTPIKECYQAMDYLVVFENENEIANAKPILEKLKNIDARGVIITAKSETYDFVCRFFAPKYGIDEDPVTGSAFTQLVPYWNETLGKNSFEAKQISKRGGEVFCTLKGDRVTIAGSGVKFFEAVIEI